MPNNSYFKLKQCIYSPVALENNILNWPGSDFSLNQDPTLSVKNIILNLHRLFSHCINPLIEKFGDNLVLISAYRNKEVNKILGGVENSQHIYGYAADIAINNNIPSAYLFNWCKLYIPQYHQLIWEYPEKGDFSSDTINFSWVHISYIQGNNDKINSISSTNPRTHNAYKSEDTFFLNNFTHRIPFANQQKLK